MPKIILGEEVIIKFVFLGAIQLGKGFCAAEDLEQMSVNIKRKKGKINLTLNMFCRKTSSSSSRHRLRTMAQKSGK